MEKFIVDERTGLKYELVGDYYLLAGDEEPEPRLIGVWGTRRQIFLRENFRIQYYTLLTTGKLWDYLADVNEAATDMLLRLVPGMAKAEGITEKLKSDDWMEWVRRMNNVQNRAEEIVRYELIYTEI